MSLTYSEMTVEHLDQVAAIEAKSNPDPWSRSLLEAEFSVPVHSRFWLVALDGDQPVAFGGLMFVGDDAHLMNIAVDPSARRQGIAAELCDRLVVGAVCRGATNLTLEVRASNVEAIALYERLGMHSAGVRPGYYQDGEDAIIMWCFDIHQMSGVGADCSGPQ